MVGRSAAEASPLPSGDEAQGGLRQPAASLAALALQEASADPTRARRLGAEALSRAGEEGDAAAASLAEQALGVAARRCHDMGAAVDHLRRAVKIADAAGLEVRAAQARVGLCGVLAVTGDTRGALREADCAAAVLRGPDLALLQAQRAFLLQMEGQLAPSLEGYTRALPIFRRAGDSFHQAKVLANRGLVHAHLGNDRSAVAACSGPRRSTPGSARTASPPTCG